MAVVDSLELLSKSTHVGADETSSDAENFQQGSTASNSSGDPNEPGHVPPYMKNVNKPHSRQYAKMTDSDWKQLQKLEVDDSPNRNSSVQFAAVQSSQRSSRKSSILKRSSVEAEKTTEKTQNALEPIQQKCREAMSKMKMESVLAMLCEDENEEAKIENS